MMAFCYKLMAESPRRSGLVSPRKSPKGSGNSSYASCQRACDETLGNILRAIEHSPLNTRDLICDVPEKDWRLLATLAKKKKDEEDRQQFASQYTKLWQLGQEASQFESAVLQDKYNRYIHYKRDHERIFHHFKNTEREQEEKLRSALLMTSIQLKDHRKAHLLAALQDQKEHLLTEKALDEEARSLMAAARRTKLEVEDECIKRARLMDAQSKLIKANLRRDQTIKDAAQRVAVYNALSQWESHLLRQEVSALDEFRRAQHAAHANLTNLRSMRLAQERDRRLERAKRLAALTGQLRECVKGSRI